MEYIPLLYGHDSGQVVPQMQSRAFPPGSTVRSIQQVVPQLKYIVGRSGPSSSTLVCQVFFFVGKLRKGGPFLLKRSLLAQPVHSLTI